MLACPFAVSTEPSAVAPTAIEVHVFFGCLMSALLVVAGSQFSARVVYSETYSLHTDKNQHI